MKKLNLYRTVMVIITVLLPSLVFASVWEMRTVDNDVFGGTSIGLDTSDNPHISYSHYGDLKYAYYDGSWHIEIVDSDGEVDWHSSLALDTSNNPHISYCDNTITFENGNLKYAYYDGSWHTITVDRYGVVGWHSSLALDTGNNPHISYHDASNQSLKYAWCDMECGNTDNWNNVTVDSDPYVGLDTSIALDTSNNPHISYYDSSNNDLKYAYYDGSWHTITVDSDGYVGLSTSLALDSSDNPHISYSGNGDLKYAYYNGSWHTEIVDSDGNVGASTSLTLDSNDNPHISYYDWDNDDLKYTYYDGSWHTEIVDSDSDVGRSNSLALDTSNNPHISYWDSSNNDLKYARQCDVMDTDCDGINDSNDNCPDTPNSDQLDTYPPGGNNIGDACDCECDFDCSGGVDATDVGAFLVDFGRSTFNNPCTNSVPCNGDVDCNGRCDANDVTMFLQDFGRSQFFNPCPACEVSNWCLYEGDPFIKEYSDSGCLGMTQGEYSSSAFDECNIEDWATAEVVGDSIYVSVYVTYNCCSSIEVELSDEGNNLNVLVQEIFGRACFCNCCFRVDAELTGLTPNEYTLEICSQGFNNPPVCETVVVVVP